jgi:pyridoxine kinase
VIDPIMGDTPKGLYVTPAVADRVADRLVPVADFITPNLWELDLLAGADLHTLEKARDAARALGPPALITSVPAGADEVGLLYVDANDAVLFAHERLPEAPNGTGDLVTASFGAWLVAGKPPVEAAERAARAAAETVRAVQDWRAPELPIVALAERLVRPTAEVRIERL